MQIHSVQNRVKICKFKSSNLLLLLYCWYYFIIKQRHIIHNMQKDEERAGIAGFLSYTISSLNFAYIFFFYWNFWSFKGLLCSFLPCGPSRVVPLMLSSTCSLCTCLLGTTFWTLLPSFHRTLTVHFFSRHLPGKFITQSPPGLNILSKLIIREQTKFVHKIIEWLGWEWTSKII